MSGKRTAIPALPTTDPGLARFAEAVAANIHRMTGQTKNSAALGRLDATASTADIVAFLNRLADRLEPQ